LGSAQTVNSSRRLSSDEPAAERGHPRDRLRAPQPVERVHAAVELQVGELDRGARREARAPRGVLGLVERDLGDERLHAAMLPALA
jgi:hypothetical protein